MMRLLGITCLSLLLLIGYGGSSKALADVYVSDAGDITHHAVGSVAYSRTEYSTVYSDTLKYSGYRRNVTNCIKMFDFDKIYFRCGNEDYLPEFQNGRVVYKPR